MSRPSFHSIHRHGLVRVAAATPLATVGDVDANVVAILDLGAQAHRAGADLVLFPELSLSSYAIDDLLGQDALLDRVERGLERIAADSGRLDPVLIVGAPLRHSGRLYNCAVVIAAGRVLGVVPKSFLPNYREFHEKRWFASGAGVAGATIGLGGGDVPFGTDLLFRAAPLPDFSFHVEICEDYWTATPPSTMGALAGAHILCNLSASNIVVGKARDRALLSAAHAMRTLSAYVFAAAGHGESTTDLAWDGQASIHELGRLLASSERFADGPKLTIADVDVGRLRLERMHTPSFGDAADAAGRPQQRFRAVVFPHRVHAGDVGLRRAVPRFPFVPDDPRELDADCYEAFNIQVDALVRRMRATGSRHMVIGVSGGLDSTHALIVAARAADRLGMERSAILAYTMPGFATGADSKASAWRLMRALGVAAAELDIRPAACQMLADLGHPFAAGQPVYDVTFENVQAGLRTDYLFRLANRHGGIVLGTGDLSELALGWCTYGVGDQMSHYGVNSGVPKTLIQHLIRWTIRTGQFDEETTRTLAAVVDAVISPELVPADAAGAIQSTEAMIGPYPLHDFFLHHLVRFGMAPSKVVFLAHHAWGDAARGEWPEAYPRSARRAYDRPAIAHWLGVFLARFFGSTQFKRSALPNGPKISAAGALSPRGDWRAPSDGSPRVWLDELAEAMADLVREEGP